MLKKWDIRRLLDVLDLDFGIRRTSTHRHSAKIYTVITVACTYKVGLPSYLGSWGKQSFSPACSNEKCIDFKR